MSIQENTPKIEMRDVKKSFGSKAVLNGIDLTVNKGESMVIIGGSGTGKSVTLKCVLGLMQPDSGSITHEKIRYVVPRRCVIRFHESMGKHRFWPDTGQKNE